MSEAIDDFSERIAIFARLLQENTCSVEEAGANLLEASRLFNETLSNDPHLAESWNRRLRKTKHKQA